ncbi:MAG: metallophosphoesterase [Acidobacteria bacterium]|nr:metallophosphoesterase [Acidobacteriota bacterium]
MKRQIRSRTLLSACGAVLCLTLSQTGPAAVSTFAQQTQTAAGAETAKTVEAAAFEGRVKHYSTLREGLEARLPKLPKDAAPEQITAHKAAFQELVRQARAEAKQGELFTPAVAELIRAAIREEFKGRERAELRETVLEAETKGIAVRVNHTYPESKELVEMPPTLLLRLPQLTKHVRYRFVGSNLLLVDRENGLILDYMTNAVPGAPLGALARKAEPEKAETVPPASGQQVAAAVAPAASALRLTLPLKGDSVKFAAIGDTGTGTAQQKELADVMINYRRAFPYEFVLMMGDNMYGGEKPEDFRTKFEDIYRPLLDDQVKFYATLGNHDESNQRFYENFNMKGEEYYRLRKGNVAFYSLNSNYMDKRQLKWLEDQLAKEGAEWKVIYMHHPPYSSGGKHGSSVKLRQVVEPIFLKYGVNVVLAGHEHFYERTKPQKGIHYIISGAGGKLRAGDVKDNSPLTAKAYDRAGLIPRPASFSARLQQLKKKPPRPYFAARRLLDPARTRGPDSPLYWQPRAARIAAASVVSCAACAAESFLPDCALAWLMKSERRAHPVELSPALTASSAARSLTIRLFAVPKGRL